VMAEPGNAERAATALQNAQAGEIIRTKFTPQWFELRSVEMGWLKEWGAWLVVVRNELSLYWIDHLASRYSWPIYYWRDSSLREVLRAAPVSNVANDSPGSTPHHLEPCGSCLNFTPQRMGLPSSDDVHPCAICGQGYGSASGSPDEEMIDDLRAI